MWFNARTLSLVPSRNSEEDMRPSASAGKGRFCFAVSPPSMPTERWYEACEGLHVDVAMSRWLVASPNSSFVIHHSSFEWGYAILKLRSVRWRSTEMCPCDEACKTVRLVEIFFYLSRRKSVILGEETAKQHLPCAELSGFVRLATSRKNKKDCQRFPLSLMSIVRLLENNMQSFFHGFYG